MSFEVDFSEWHFETLKILILSVQVDFLKLHHLDFKMLKMVFWVDFSEQHFLYYPNNIFWILVTKIEPSRRFFEGKSRLSPHLTYTSHYYNSITPSMGSDCANTILQEKMKKKY